MSELMPSELTRLLRNIDDQERALKGHRQKIIGLIVGDLLLIISTVFLSIIVPVSSKDGGNPLAGCMLLTSFIFLSLNIGMGIWIAETKNAARYLRNARYKYQDYIEDMQG